MISTVATTRLSAPTSSTAGTAFDVIVTALDAYGNTATGYTGTVHFTGADGQALLPGGAFRAARCQLVLFGLHGAAQNGERFTQAGAFRFCFGAS